MSLKAKLVSTIAAIALVLAILVGGVFAAQQATVNMSGTVSFVSQDVNAVVSYVTEGSTTLKAPATAPTAIEFNAANAATGTWDALDYDLVAEVNETTKAVTYTAVFKVKVENKATDRKISVAITPTENTDLTLTTDLATVGAEIAENGNATYTFTIQLNAASATTSGNFDYAFTMVLTNVAA